jgi:two-component system chemotaxis sensor kinase CheA
MNELHEQFVIEARELIQQAADDLIALEGAGAPAERIDSVFRAFHTLKGSAGVVDLPAMGLVLHAAEDLLAAVQAGRLAASPQIVDAALACLDQVSDWVEAFAASGALPGSANDHARTLTERLRGLASATAPTAAPAPAPPVSSPAAARVGAVPDWALDLIEEQRGRGGEPASSLHAINYEPHAGCFFNGDDPLGLMRKLPGLLVLRIEAREPWPALADLDPYACNLRLRALVSAEHAELTTLFRLVPDQVRIVALPADALRAAPAAAAPDLVQAVIAEQCEVLRAATPQGLAGRIGAVARTAANAWRHAGRADLAERIAKAAAAAVAASDVAPLLAWLQDAEQDAAPDEPAAPSEAAGAGSRSLRVDEARIDSLINLAGELTVIRNGFAHLTRRLDAEFGHSDLARAMRHESDSFDRIAAELRGAILQLRMVPVAQAFRPLPRMVRDIARRLGKNVTLVTQGETTESDKTIVDLLSEPLLHLVRNALDHGIEAPEQRREAGKLEVATLTLRASQAGDRMIVEVIDDGRGIDPAVIRQRALDKGLVSAARAADLSDQQAIDLIFAPGFSTAAALSDLSGRGVGMDVVRSAIEGIGGRVTLASLVGAGTTVTLDLPMTIAMLRIMVVEAGGQLFGLPMDAVVRTVRLAPDQISRIKTNEGFVLDDRVVPICALSDLMKLPRRDASDAKVRLVVVAEAGGRLTGIEVDAIRDRLEVVLKPLEGVLAGARGYAGTTLLGDGAVLLVLDLKEIAP